MNQTASMFIEGNKLYLVMLTRIFRFFVPFLFVALFTACGSSGSPAPYANTVAQMTASVQKQLAESGATGGVSIALVDDQKVVWTKSFGYADAATRTLATPDTTYRICSITKTFTGTMIMQLADQGLLEISDPLTRCGLSHSMDLNFLYI